MKQAFALVVLIVTPALAFAQGTVVFQNLTGAVREPVPFTSLITGVGKGNAMVDLITAAHGIALLHPLGMIASDASLGTGVFVPTYTTLASFLAANPGWHSEAVGDVNAGNGIFNNGTVSLTGIPGGASADYLIIGWTGTYQNLDAAIAGGAWLGESGVFTTITGDPTTTPPGIPVSLKSTFTGVTVFPLMIIPEPSIFALFALGAAMVVPIRRCK